MPRILQDLIPTYLFLYLISSTFSNSVTTASALQPYMPACYSFNNQAHSHLRTIALPAPAASKILSPYL